MLFYEQLAICYLSIAPTYAKSCKTTTILRQNVFSLHITIQTSNSNHLFLYKKQCEARYHNTAILENNEVHTMYRYPKTSTSGVSIVSHLLHGQFKIYPKYTLFLDSQFSKNGVYFNIGQS